MLGISIGAVISLKFLVSGEIAGGEAELHGLSVGILCQFNWNVPMLTLLWLLA